MVRYRFALALLAAGVLLTAATPVSVGPLYPPGVPNLTDQDVQNSMLVLAISQLDGDPNFPVLVLAGTSEELPRYLLVVVDARNGKETWSLLEDRPVFFMVFSEPNVLRAAYLDEGFATNGKPSGKFSGVGPEAVNGLVVKLRDGYQRARGLAALSFSL